MSVSTRTLSCDARWARYSLTFQAASRTSFCVHHYGHNIATTWLRSAEAGAIVSSFCTEQREHLFIGILVANHYGMGGHMEGLGHGDSGARKHDLF